MVATRLTNPSFTLSHDCVVCPNWACLQVTTHRHLYMRHTFVHNLHTSPKVTPCTLARWAGAHPSHPRTCAKSSHKPGAHTLVQPSGTPSHNRAPHLCTPFSNRWVNSTGALHPNQEVIYLHAALPKNRRFTKTVPSLFAASTP